MIRYECDKCGAELQANDHQRYIAKLEIFAAASPIDITPVRPEDTTRALDEVIKQLQSANPDDIEDQTYRCFRFDLCDTCRKKVIDKPLG